MSSTPVWHLGSTALLPLLRKGCVSVDRITANNAASTLPLMETLLILWLISAILVITGLVGLVAPGLPGAPLIFAGLLLAAWAEGFEYVGFGAMLAIGVVGLLTFAVDIWATMFGARKFGASRRAVIGALLGLVAGIFLGFPGVIFGPFIGAVIGELSARRTLDQATRAGVGATIGFVLGAALKLALAFAMIGIYLVARFF